MDTMEMGISLSAPDQSQDQSQQPQPVVNVPDQQYVQSADQSSTREIQQNNFVFDAGELRKAATNIVTNKQSFDEESLRNDPMFLESARIIGKRNAPEEAMFWDDNQTLDFALEYIGQVNYNLPKAISTAVEFDGETEDNLAALAYMLEAYEAKETSIEGFGRFTWGVFTDPTTYLSIGSFGLAAGAQTAAKMTALSTLKQSLLKTANLAAIEAGVYSGVADAAGQYTDIATGKQKEYSGGQTTAAIGVGALIGKGAVEGFSALGRGIGKMYQQGEREAMKAAGGGELTFETLLQQSKELPVKQQQKRLSSMMRFATPDEKKQIIEQMKNITPVKKPKSPAVEKIIKEQEEFNGKFYSKLEHEINNLQDGDYEIAHLINHLKDNGVKLSEIEGSGLHKHLASKVENGETSVALSDVKSKLSYRRDKIYLNRYNEGTEGMTLDRADWEEGVDINEVSNVNVGETGFGVRVEDNNRGTDFEIGSQYDYDVYVDSSGIEYDYDGAVDDFLEYTGEEYLTKVKHLEAEEQGIDVDDVDVTWDMKNKAIDDAESDGVYLQDEYTSRENWVTEGGHTFDNKDDAIEWTLEAMYDDYYHYGGGAESDMFADYTVGGGDLYEMRVYRMEDFDANWRETHKEKHLAEVDKPSDHVQAHVRFKERTDVDGKKGRVLEELQSQWEQDWRKAGGGVTPSTPEEKAVAQKELDQLVQDVAPIKAERDAFIESSSKERDAQLLHLSELEWSEPPHPELEKARHEYNKMGAKHSKVIKELDVKMGAMESRANELNTIINPPSPDVAAPPMSKRTQYEKLGLMDTLTESIENGEDYFGFINGHIQNGSSIETTPGMINAYDIEMPRIIQKQTGLTPYMARFHDGRPVSGEKVYWNMRDAKTLDHYDNISTETNNGEKWYWRVDYTPEVTSNVKKSKIELYGVGGISLIGATQQNEKEQ